MILFQDGPSAVPWVADASAVPHGPLPPVRSHEWGTLAWADEHSRYTVLLANNIIRQQTSIHLALVVPSGNPCPLSRTEVS
jgi:hypothetical protein